MYGERHQNLSGIAVEKKVGEVRRTVDGAGRVQGRHEVVVEVVIASEHQNRYGLGQVLCQVPSSAHHCS